MNTALTDDWSDDEDEDEKPTRRNIPWTYVPFSHVLQLFHLETIFAKCLYIDVVRLCETNST